MRERHFFLQHPSDTENNGMGSSQFPESTGSAQRWNHALNTLVLKVTKDMGYLINGKKKILVFEAVFKTKFYRKNDSTENKKEKTSKKVGPNCRLSVFFCCFV